jgi:pilus assembly protein CpaB
VRGSTVVMIAVAAVFGLLAVFLAQVWLNRQDSLRMRNLESRSKPVATRVVVVARSPLRFGSALTAQNLREVEWPGEAVPANSFSSISELTRGDKRVVLASIEANEPVVGNKITGPGQKATLSALIDDGMKAVTVRVNDVEGVAGFVLPGDRVDVLLTRHGEKEASSSDVVLQNVKVLAIDQIADERAEKPVVVKAVTLEVDTISAQKLALAAAAGNLSLVLRKAGDSAQESARRVTITDIGSSTSAPTGTSSFTTIRVIRAAKSDEYSVPVENFGRVQSSGAPRGDAHP